jgi:hypothetical protein
VLADMPKAEAKPAPMMQKLKLSMAR